MPQEPTNTEILNAINDFADHVEERFDGVESRIDGVESRIDGVESRIDGVESKINRIEATMVTKDYLDDKLADLRGDLVVLMRKEDKKVMALIDILKERKLITDDDVKKIMAMEPFPQSL